MGRLEEEIIDSILSRYLLIYSVDLENDYMEVVYETEKYGTFGMERSGRYSELNSKYSQERVDLEFSKWREDVGSIDNLKKELTDKDYFDLAFPVNYGKWRSVEYRVVARRREIPTKVIMCYKKVDDDRAEVFLMRQEREHNRSLLEDMLNKEREAGVRRMVFLANMSQELRVTMNSVVGDAAMALQSEEDELVRTNLERILKNSTQMQRLITNTLDLVRIETGRVRIDATPNDLKTVIRDLQEIIEPMAEAKNQSFSVEMGHLTHSKVICDRGNLSIVLLNLLRNAVKFTPEGGALRLAVRHRKSHEPDSLSYEFQVEDNGIGIGEEFQKKLFEPFAREYVNEYEGAGLGLRIAYRLTQLMGGTITVHSTRGVGSSFTVILDLKLQDPVELLPKRAEDEKVPIEQLMAGKRFLVVEDSMINTAIMTKFMNHLGADVEHAEDGMRAIAMVRKNPADYYDGIIMDIQMPVMNGYEATETIRMMDGGASSRSSVPIIGVSANAYEVDREKALAAGMDAYLSKPVDIEELMSVLSQVMH